MATPIESSSAEEDYPDSQVTHHGLDLEKQDTETLSIWSNSGPNPASQTRARITRTQSLTRRATNRGRFTHPLSHLKTSEAEIVDFDGPDDPYRPINVREFQDISFPFGAISLDVRPDSTPETLSPE
jgi:hypothetical protein